MSSRAKLLYKASPVFFLVVESMYSVLPAIVSLLFLGYGLYVVAAHGVTRISSSFFALCITTFFWQATWAVLFQVSDPELAMFLIKFGYLLILFLPTSLYQLLVEIAGQAAERAYVYFSYGITAILAVFLLVSDMFVSGYYEYFFGLYPKAGLLHPLHVVQTVIVVSRGLYITYRTQKTAPIRLRKQLRWCLVSLGIYFFAAVDYLCNYGIEFYPPGVVFIAIAPGAIAVALTKYDLIKPMALLATVAHEMRTPLASIRFQAKAIEKHWPVLLRGYQLAIQHGLCEPRIRTGQLNALSTLSSKITKEVERSNVIIDMMLASAAMDNPNSISFARYSMQACIAEALDCYPFDAGEREKVYLSIGDGFDFHGSKSLMVCVLFNLMKNALYAIQQAGKGHVHIVVSGDDSHNILRFIDTGLGVSPEALPHIFEDFYTTKHHAGGSGIGLPFCKRVMEAFDGRISGKSEEGKYMVLTLAFPVLAESVEPNLNRHNILEPR